MKKIYLVRHGESEENIGGVMQGGPTPLSPKGHEQAQFIAQRATKLPIEVIIPSTMLRARQTAEYIAKATGKPVEPSALFVEKRPPTAMLGSLASDPKMKELDDVLHTSFGEDNYQHSDEETTSEMNARAKQALDYLAGRTEQEILVVTHGLFLRSLVGAVLFGDKLSIRETAHLLNGLKTVNTGLTIFVHNPEDPHGAVWKMLTWNDHAHLAD
jgi:probable phosphoglycerate mutase